MSDKKNTIIFFCIVFGISAIFVYFGINNFLRLESKSFITNLRWFNSALIQVYGSILAISPAVSLAFLSFSSSKYPSGLMKRLLSFFEIKFFFGSITFCIIICSVILISQNDFITELTSIMKIYVILDIFTIFLAILAIYLLLEGINKVIGLENILHDFIKRIDTDDETEQREIYNEYHTLLHQIAKDRNLIDLHVVFKNLFKMVIVNENIYDDIRRTIYDIRNIFRENDELNCLSVLNDSIENGYVMIAESNNFTLINKASGHMSQPGRNEIGEGKGLIPFYNHHIKRNGWNPNMNPNDMAKIVRALLQTEERLNIRIIEFEPSVIDFFINISSFIFDAWEEVPESEKSTFGENHLIKNIKSMVEKFKDTDISSLDLDTMNKLECIVNKINNLREYFNGRSGEFNNFLTVLRITSSQHGTFIHYLHERIIEE